MKKVMKTLTSLTLALLMCFSLVCVMPNVKADAATSGVYTYEVQESMALITEISSSVSGDLKIPEKIDGYPVTYIAPFAAMECVNLKSVTLPANLEIADVCAFYGCTNLENIYVNKNNKTYTSVNGVLYSKDKTILCIYPNAKGSSYKIIDGTKIIDACAFTGTDIAKVYMPTSLTSIGYGAFMESTSLSSFYIPNTVTSVDGAAFAGCTSLTDFSFSNKMKTISEYMLQSCTALKNITLPDNITTIEKEAFLGCSSLTSVSLGKGVNALQIDAFKDCENLQKISVSAANTVFSDDSGVLYSKDKTKLYLYPTGNARTRYNVNALTKYIQTNSFATTGECKLKEVSLPKRVTHILSGAFTDCASIEKIHLSGVTEYIDDTAFDGCTNLTIYSPTQSGGTTIARDFANKKGILFVASDYTRLAGMTRYATAWEIAKEGWDECSTVVVANGLKYADALSGVSIAGAFDAPIFLTEGTDVEGFKDDCYYNTLWYKAEKVIILGGDGAVSEEIEEYIKSMGYEVTRLAGADRYGTSLEISKDLDPAPETAIIVTGTGYADSLSISPISAMYAYPIIYANPNTGLSDEALEYLAETENIIIIGGPGAVSEYTESQLEGKNIKRIAGMDRYLTSYKIAEEYKDSFGDDVMIATGKNFPDALAGGVLAAKYKTPLLLTQENGLIDEMKAYVEEKGSQNVYVLGGDGVVPSLVAAELYK